jgi:class 3 adenylate cyclase/pimeloyl-ACP methyl ester carboxylesterase
MEPEIRYVRSADGTRIATASVGSGSPLLAMTPTGLGSVEATFGIPAWEQEVAALAERFRLVTYDPRGQGLSDRDTEDLSLEARVADLAAVVDALELPPVNLLARGLTCQTTIAYAAQFPQRVRRLVLWAGVATGRAMRLTDRYRLIAPLVNVDWPLYCQFVSLMDFGWTDTARRASEHLARSITPENYSRNWLASRDHDATQYAGGIRCPTLLVWPKGIEDRVRIESVRDLAAQIPGATFRTSDSFGLFWGQGALDTRIVMEFFSGEDEVQAVRAAGSATQVVLFADIAASTELTERLGDAAFRAKAREADEAMRAAVRQQGGSVIDAKTLGDGILATFAAASQAIAAALSFEEAIMRTGLGLHVGLHAGDVLWEKDNVFGGVVNIAARISALAPPGEVLVSDVVRALARTSAGVTFADRGEQTLKGIAEPQRVYAVRRVESEADGEQSD